ncbi:hypothetical protein HHI36_021578 [Cryptolaemus montrouzieri]|uniref:Diphthamide biosynthesis protein 2 n=1 Tax=Cryptolaemus montrouzieri TaxID=559131 RepID=A0ABD2MXC1_9CUCU
MKIFRLDEQINYLENGLYIYIGSNGRKLENIRFSLNDQFLYQYDPSSQNPNIFNVEENPRVLKRRYYLSEKIKDSKTFGIVMGTLAVDNYLKILGRMKKLLKLNGKKYYVISVGKISVAKLANFPEMDIYIVITCAMNEVYESKDFYKPIVTPCDVEKAFNLESEAIKFTYDYNSFLSKVTNEKELKPLEGTDISLLTGSLRSNEVDISGSVSEGGEVALKTTGALVESTEFGAGYLAARSWKGLEQDLGNTEVQYAKEGRTGIAQSYSNETEDNEKV